MEVILSTTSGGSITGTPGPFLFLHHTGEPATTGSFCPAPNLPSSSLGRMESGHLPPVVRRSEVAPNDKRRMRDPVT